MDQGRCSHRGQAKPGLRGEGMWGVSCRASPTTSLMRQLPQEQFGKGLLSPPIGRPSSLLLPALKKD